MYPAIAGIVFAAALTTGSGKDSVTATLSLASKALRENRVELAEQLLDQACSPPPQAGPARTSCLFIRSQVLKREGNYPEAERIAQEAINSWDEEQNGDKSTNVRLIVGLGDIQRSAEKWAAAKATFETALAYEKARQDAHVPSGPQIMARIASVLSQYGDYEGAMRLLTEAILQLRGANTPGELAFALANRGTVFAATGDYKKAEADFREGNQLAVKTVGEDDPELAPYLSGLAFALMQQGKFSQAELLLIRARALLEKSGSGGERDLIQTLSELSSVYSAQGQFSKAEECGMAALKKVEKEFGPDSQDAAMQRVTLATVYLQENKIAPAEQILPDAVNAERRLLKNRRLLCEGIYRLAELRAKQKRWVEADALYREAAAALGEMLGPRHPHLLAMRKEHAPVQKHARAISQQSFN